MTATRPHESKRFLGVRRMAASAAVGFVLVAAIMTSPVSADSLTSAETVAELQASDVFDDSQHAPVLRLYRAIFGREPDIEGAKYWIDVNRQGHTVLDIAGYMSGSTEWANAYSGSSNREFVARVYENVLGRDFDQEGFDYWLGLVQAGDLTRPGMVFYVSANPEFTSNFPYLGGSPDATCAGLRRLSRVTMVRPGSEHGFEFTVYTGDDPFAFDVLTTQSPIGIMHELDVERLSVRRAQFAMVETSSGLCGWVSAEYLRPVPDNASAFWCVDSLDDIVQSPGSTTPVGTIPFACSLVSELNSGTVTAEGLLWKEVKYFDHAYRAEGWVKVRDLSLAGLSGCQYDDNYCEA